LVHWDCPVTAGDEERLIARAAEPVDRGVGLVVIVADDRAWSGAMVDAARQRGFASVALRTGKLHGDAGVTMPSIEGATAVLWDTTSDLLKSPQAIARLHSLVGNTPIIATVGFPRPETISAALDNGVMHVVSKPLDVDELYFLLREVRKNAFRYPQC
jgi:DNA-binding response OmpR family regulator